MTQHHDRFAPVVVASSSTMHNGSQYACTSTHSTVRPHTSDRYICTHCDMPHDDSAHLGATIHNVVAHESNTHDGAVTSPTTVLEDSSTNDSATHYLVVPPVSDQYVITDPTSYASIRYYNIQYPTDMSSTTVPNTYTVMVYSPLIKIKGNAPSSALATLLIKNKDPHGPYQGP